MKDSILVDASIFNKFQAKSINIANYLKNQLVLERYNENFFLEKMWIDKK